MIFLKTIFKTLKLIIQLLLRLILGCIFFISPVYADTDRETTKLAYNYLGDMELKGALRVVHDKPGLVYNGHFLEPSTYLPEFNNYPELIFKHSSF